MREVAFAVYARHDHPLAGRRDIALQTLADEPMLLREVGAGTRQVTLDAFARHGLEPRVRMELASDEAIEQAIVTSPRRGGSGTRQPAWRIHAAGADNAGRARLSDQGPLAVRLSGRQTGVAGGQGVHGAGADGVCAERNSRWARTEGPSMNARV